MQIAEFTFHFSPAERQRVSIINSKKKQRQGQKKMKKAKLTSISNDFHLDLTFLRLEPKQFKRLKNCKTPILTNLRIKYKVKIQRATCTVFFN